MTDQAPAPQAPPTTDSSVKKPWLSKTLWSNLILAVVAMLPNDVLQIYLTDHPTFLPMLFLVVNTFLRFITKDAIGLSD